MTALLDEPQAEPITFKGLLSYARREVTGAQILLVLIAVAAIVFVPHFATGDNVFRIVQSEAFVGLVAIGMTFVVLAGGFVDLSVPAAIIGAFNGLMVGRFRLNPVICTLGTAAAAGGLLLLIWNGASVTGSVQGFQTFGNFHLWRLPLASLVFLGGLLLAHFAMTRTQFGSFVRLVGAGRRAAENNGARPSLIILVCFVLCGAAAGVTGLLLAGFSNVAVNTVGVGYEFDALTAIVIGGNSLTGGHGSMMRTFTGLLVVGVATNAMLLLGLSTELQYTVKGLVFIAAVATDAARARSRTRA
jgi:ribose/xylose/arabinose/galactoside ABC-type transport system permease subunit